MFEESSSKLQQGSKQQRKIYCNYHCIWKILSSKYENYEYSVIWQWNSVLYVDNKHTWKQLLASVYEYLQYKYSIFTMLCEWQVKITQLSLNKTCIINKRKLIFLKKNRNLTNVTAHPHIYTVDLWVLRRSRRTFCFFFVKYKKNDGFFLFKRTNVTYNVPEKQRMLLISMLGSVHIWNNILILISTKLTEQAEQKLCVTISNHTQPTKWA